MRIAIQITIRYTYFFFKELKGDLKELYKEVHTLASHYHWSENEILDLTRNKRKEYLELINNEEQD